jgi:NADH-quinone oxidoreductase subunit A
MTAGAPGDRGWQAPRILLSPPEDRALCGRFFFAMLDQYLPVLLQILVAGGLAASMLIFSVLLGKTGTPNATKDSAYECGMLPIGDAQPRFSVKFYMVAMLFVLFDIEVVFMYPWAVVFRDMIGTSSVIFWSMLSFVVILLVAYLYALKKGALRWND